MHGSKYNSNKRIKLNDDPLVKDYLSAKDISDNLNISRYEVHKYSKTTRLTVNEIWKSM